MALIHCDFHSDVLQLACSMDVILPQFPYASAASTKRRPLPVLFLLHGLSDDHTIWQRRTCIERYVTGKPLAVVMPAVHRSFYTDMRRGYRYWTFISEEVPALARQFFGLSAARKDNFVAGLSMGGYGAFKLALRCPDRFAAAASLSGALDLKQIFCDPRRDPPFHAEMANVYGDPAKVAGSAEDVMALAKKVARSRGPKPRLYQCCGTEDFLYSQNTAFRDHARTLGLDLTYEEGPGQHEWGYWDAMIQRVLAWLPLPPAK